MENVEIQPWWFLVEPLPGESISHFLGRFRRENELTVSMMGKITGLGGAISRWEKFRFNPPPSEMELEKLGKVVQVEVAGLWEMFPPKEVGIKHEPIRLCGVCYPESPCHKIEWQFKTTQLCPQHGLTLLSECPNCGARFPFPALWHEGWCLNIQLRLIKNLFPPHPTLPTLPTLPNFQPTLKQPTLKQPWEWGACGNMERRAVGIK